MRAEIRTALATLTAVLLCGQAAVGEHVQWAGGGGISYTSPQRDVEYEAAYNLYSSPAALGSLYADRGSAPGTTACSPTGGLLVPGLGNVTAGALSLFEDQLAVARDGGAAGWSVALYSRSNPDVKTPPGGDWTPEGVVPAAREECDPRPDNAQRDRVRVALSGGTLAVSGGATVCVYSRGQDGRRWAFQAALAVPHADPGKLGYSAGFGHAVALDDDGTTLAVGAPSASQVLLYRRVGKAWDVLEVVDIPTELRIVDFGAEVALGGGRLAVAGRSGSAPADGALLMFQQPAGADGGRWALRGAVTSSRANPSVTQGVQLAMSGNQLLTLSPSSGASQLWTAGDRGWSSTSDVLLGGGRPAALTFHDSVVVLGVQEPLGQSSVQTMQCHSTGTEAMDASRRHLAQSGPDFGTSTLFYEEKKCSGEGSPSDCTVSFSGLGNCPFVKLSAGMIQSDFTGDGEFITFTATGSGGALSGGQCTSDSQEVCDASYYCWERQEVGELVGPDGVLDVNGAIPDRVNCCCDPALQMHVIVECCENDACERM
eukprot:jgi/Tetstr1/446523/TSEL_034048.t1